MYGSYPLHELFLYKSSSGDMEESYEKLSYRQVGKASTGTLMKGAPSSP